VTVRRESGGDYWIFYVQSGVTAGITGLTISNASYCGIVNFGTLTVNNSTISDNTSPNQGGGILNAGTLTINNSTISGNTTVYGGGIYNNGNMTLNNCTVAGNSASQSAGGILGIVNSGEYAVINDCTISGNSAVISGGGLYGAPGMATRNTIIGRNSAPAGPDVWRNLGSQGHNLIGNPQDMTGWVDSDILHVDPKVGPLQNNGGPTKTMALSPGSPALNAGDPNELGNPDQRGVARTGGVNIGAYQASASIFLLSAPDTVTSGVPFDVTITAMDTLGQVAVGYTGTVTFSTSDSDPGVVLPADYSFTLDDGGVHTFADTGRGETTLTTLGDQTLTVADTLDGTITGSATVTVTSGNRLCSGPDDAWALVLESGLANPAHHRSQGW
jgi:hypothetical protein